VLRSLYADGSGGREYACLPAGRLIHGFAVPWGSCPKGVLQYRLLIQASLDRNHFLGLDPTAGAVERPLSELRKAVRGMRRTVRR
jgi:hypothetical protein